MDVASRLMEQLDGWSFEQGHLAKSYTFADFAGALEFVNRIGAIAEEQGHHPDIYMTWGKVSVERAELRDNAALLGCEWLGRNA